MFGRERATLQPWYQPFAAPHMRKLDAAEHAELVHLHRTGQQTAEALARRFGISVRSVYRYLREHPESVAVSAAGLRVLHEARSIGIRVTPNEAERLAIAALLVRGAA